MLRSTMVAVFVLLAYAMIFAGFLFPEFELFLLADMLVLNVLAFYVTYGKVAAPVSKEKEKEKELELAAERHGGMGSVRHELAKHEIRQAERKKKGYTTMSTLILIALSFLLVVGLILVGMLVTGRPGGLNINWSFALLSYVLICMLVIRMQWAHNYELETGRLR